MRIKAFLQRQRVIEVRTLLTLCFGTLLFGTALATPEEMERFHTVLKVKESSKLFKADCMSCHTDPPQHNPFGAQIKANLRREGKARLDAGTLQALSMLDADGDGWSNQAEWQADTLPGDAKSHPVGEPPKPEAQPSKKDSESPLKALDPLLPKHSMHPLMVHFPIALFLFGTGLELLGIRKKSDDLRRSAWLCLLFGAISAWFAIPTGLLAFYRVGFTWSGNALIHFILAVSSTLLMTGIVTWRKRGTHTSLLYVIALGATALFVALAGHFGGLLVYGN